jgi:hypothetical protein
MRATFRFHILMANKISVKRKKAMSPGLRKEQIIIPVSSFFLIGTLMFPPVSGKEAAVSGALQKIPGVKGKELWIGGTVDPVARKALEERGWKAGDKVEQRLLKKDSWGRGGRKNCTTEALWTQ